MKTCPQCKRSFSDEVSFCNLDGSRLKDAPLATSTLIGKTIRDNYRIDQKLAETGMSVLYLASDVNMKRKVLLQVFNEEYTRNEACVERFLRDAQLTASISHPNIAQVYDVGQDDDGKLFMVTEFLAGADLKATIRKGPVETPRAVRLSLQIANALTVAHQAGLVHRDLKPGNIMVGTGEEAKLINFGIARLKESEELTRLTEVATIFGTPAYMAPEQAEGGDIDARTDIYAFGIILYELLTNVVPFRAPTPAAVLMKHVKEAPRPLRELRPDVPGQLERVVMQALEKKPNLRWAQITEVAAELGKVENELSRKPPVDIWTGTQVLEVEPAFLRPAAHGEPLSKETQSTTPEASSYSPAAPGSYPLEEKSDQGKVSQNYSQTIAAQPVMVETMAMTQPLELLRQKERRWKWLGLGGGIAVAGLLAAWLAMFLYHRMPGRKEQTAATQPLSTSSAKKQILGVTINADRKALTLRERSELQLRVQYQEGATEKVSDKQLVQWASSDPSVVDISQEGEITARGIGRAAITARYKGMETPAITVVVTAPASFSGVAEPALLSLTIRRGKKEIDTKGRLSLRVMGMYSDGQEKELKAGVQWESSDIRIATINSKGDVIGQREGPVDIIARSGNIASNPLNLLIKAPVKKREAQTVKGLSADKIAELTNYMKTAKSYRDRGEYVEALTELGKATKIDPTNQEVQSEIANTRSACNAEKKLGRSELNC